MDTFTVTPQTKTGAYTSVSSRRGSQSSDWPEGTTITATLTDMNNGTATLRTKDDYTFQASGAAISGKVGDMLTFQVVKNDKSGLSLKQVLSRRDDEQPRRAAQKEGSSPFEIKEFTKTITSISDEEKQQTETQQENQVKAARAIASIQRAQQYMNGTASPSAISALIESGLSLTKISFTLLNQVVHETDKRPSTGMTTEEKRTAAALPFKNAEDAKSIVRSLHQNGLSVNEKNIAALERAWEKIPARVDDRTIERMIANESEITPANLYVSRYSSSKGGATGSSQADQWESLAGEVQKLFKREGIDDTAVNREAARFLVTRDLPLEKESLKKTVFLRRLSENISKDAFYNRAAERLAADKNIADMPLIEMAADHAADPNSPLTKQTLRAVEAATQGLSTVENDTLRRALAAAPDVRWDERITARRTLAEVQLKLTTEAAARLNNTDISINTEPLRDAVRYLAQLEKEYYARCLRMAGTDDGAEPVSHMSQLFDTLADSKPLTVNVHANILRGRTDFTITGVHDSILAARAQSGYETFSTVPNPRYGDSFAKVKASFAPLLEELNITPTAENTKAAFILSKSKMDVNWENVLAVKEIDAKINAITNSLHPMIAAQMIKEGLHPLNMQADQVLDYIKQYKHVYGEDGGDKITRYIREMDENHTLDEDTRKSMIAVYRTLNVIQKDGASALGLAARQDQPLTLGGLMELAKYHEKQKKNGTVYDRTVDDAFGYMAQIIRPESSIRSLLENTARPRPPLTYTDITADNFIDRAQPENLRSLLEDVPDGEQLPVEDINIQTNPQNKPDTQAVLTQIQAFSMATPDMITLLQSKNITVTAGMVTAMGKITRSPRVLAETLEDLLDNVDEETAEAIEQAIPDTELQSLREGRSSESVYASLLAKLDEASAAAESYAPFVRIDAARQMTALRAGLNGENGFQMPVRVNDSLSNLNLYVLNEQALLNEGARVLMSLDTRTLGTVQGYFTLSDSAVNVLITAESSEKLSALQAESDTLLTSLNDAGITVERLQFSLTDTLTDTRPPEQTEAPVTSATAEKRTDLSGHEYLI